MLEWLIAQRFTLHLFTEPNLMHCNNCLIAMGKFPTFQLIKERRKERKKIPYLPCSDPTNYPLLEGLFLRPPSFLFGEKLWRKLSILVVLGCFLVLQLDKIL